VLDTAGRTIEVGARHLAYFLALAEEAERHLAGPDQDDWLGRLDADVGNFVAALRWSVGELREPEAGLRLVTALWRFWYLRGRYSTGREWLDAALRAAGGAPTLVRAQALAAAGQLAYLQCDYRTSSRRLEEARNLFASRSDPLGVATVLQSLGCVAREQGAYVRSRELHMESQRRFRLADHAEGVARAEHYLGFVALLEGDLSQAEEQGRRAQPWFRAAGDGEGFAWSLLLQGAAATYAGELDAAERLLQESLRRSERTGYREGVAWSLNQLGVVAARRGEQDRARTLQRDSLGAHWQLGDLWRTASALEALAGCESRPAHQDWATHLLGAAVTLRRRLGAPIPPVERPDVDAAAVRLQTTLGERYAGAHAAGRADELEQTVRRELGRVG
jgi:tetratricopeptide (TPR) repeat protein